MKPRAGGVRVAGAAVSLIVAILAACGGKVDADAMWLSAPASPPPTGRPPGGSTSSRPAPPPMSTASAASQIAETYCKTFSSCCVAMSQPPIDVARCREVTSRAVEDSLASAGPELPVAAVITCVEAIRTRTAACGREDVAWWAAGDLALFGPSSVRIACHALIGPGEDAAVTDCGQTKPCAEGGICAVDECVSVSRPGQACSDRACLDGSVCDSTKTCQVPASIELGGTCVKDADCLLGAVCFSSKCASAREHPELYSERHSPYRVGSDTCRVFASL